MVDSDKAKEEILLARRMFLAGCLGLPWLWICNALYFRLKVFGPKVILDYWPGHAPPQPESEEGNNDNSGESEGETMEQQLERQVQKQELEKWVKRSTRGAVIVMGIFVAWIVTFQCLKDSFPSGWFVMDESDAEVTGW